MNGGRAERKKNEKRQKAKRKKNERRQKASKGSYHARRNFIVQSGFFTTLTCVVFLAPTALLVKMI